MKLLRFYIIGIVFGIVLTKAEIISWYRIYEMFRFESFHMFGVIGSAVVLGIVMLQIVKRTRLNSIEGKPITTEPKDMSITRYLAGGIIFGFGWALTGACPGPLFILVGAGVYVMILGVISAVAGTFVYGLLRDKLPH